jgi:hypothetical protein
MRGRVRTFASALTVWVTLVFAIDALLLTLIVALAPVAPQVGMHGHSEMSSAMQQDHMQSNAEKKNGVSPAAWLLTINPVDLFRFGVLAAAPQFNAELALMLPGTAPESLRFPLIAGSIFWLAAPLILALRRFLRASLN